MRRSAWNDYSKPFPNYPYLQEQFIEWWHKFTQTCEMSTLAPVWVLENTGYTLVQVDREVWEWREQCGLDDDYQFYDVLTEDGAVLEVWGHNGYSSDEEACLLYRDYGEIERYLEHEEE